MIFLKKIFSETHVPRGPCTQFHNIIPDSIHLLLIFFAASLRPGLPDMVPMRVSITTLGFAAIALLNAPGQVAVQLWSLVLRKEKDPQDKTKLLSSFELP